MYQTIGIKSAENGQLHHAAAARYCILLLF